MIGNLNNVFTYVLTNDTLTILAEYGLEVVYIKLVSGSASYYGNKKIGTHDSAPIPMALNEGVTISVGLIIDKLTIDATSGVVQILAR